MAQETLAHTRDESVSRPPLANGQPLIGALDMMFRRHQMTLSFA